MSVERIARALEGIRRNARHAERCRNRAIAQWKVDGCICDAAVEAQAAAVLEALEEAAAEAYHLGSCVYPLQGYHDVFYAALERIAGSPRDKEEIPNA